MHCRSRSLRSQDGGRVGKYGEDRCEIMTGKRETTSPLHLQLDLKRYAQLYYKGSVEYRKCPRSGPACAPCSPQAELLRRAARAGRRAGSDASLAAPSQPPCLAQTCSPSMDNCRVSPARGASGTGEGAAKPGEVCDIDSRTSFPTSRSTSSGRYAVCATYVWRASGARPSSHLHRIGCRGHMTRLRHNTLITYPGDTP
jgi:hypothetical protein